MGHRAQKASDKFNNLGGAIGSAAIIGGMAMAVKQSVAVEDALADLVRVGDLTEAQLASMDGAMESLSQTLGKSKIGLLEQAFEGLKLGIPFEELENFVKLAARTSIAFDMGEQETGAALGSIRAKLGLNTDALGNLMDSINFVSDNSAALGKKMVNIIERTSGVMGTLQFPPEVIAGVAAFADQLESTPQLAASGLNQMFAKMQKSSKFTKNLMDDPVKAIRHVLQQFSDIDPAKRFAAIEKLFGLESARFMMKAVNRLELFDETMETAARNEALGSMMRELENRGRRTSTLLKIMGVVGVNTLAVIGDALKPAVKAMARFTILVGDAVKTFAKKRPAMVQFAAIFATIVAIASVAGLVLGGLAIAIGLISGPVILVSAGIGLLIGAMVRWVDTNNPVIKTLGKIVDNLKKAFAPLAKFFGITGEGTLGIELLVKAIDALGVAFSVSLTPLEVLTRAIQGLFEIYQAIINLDFGAMTDAYSSMAKDIGNIVLGKGADITSLFSGPKFLSDREDAISAPLADFFGLTEEGMAAIDLLVKGIDAIGVVLSVVLTPVQILARAIQGLIEMFMAVIDLDFDAVTDAFSSMSSDIGDILLGKGIDIADLMGIESVSRPEKGRGGARPSNVSNISDTVADRKIMSESNVNMTGNIHVEALGGATVKSANIGLDQGSNLATTRGRFRQ